MTTDRVSAKSFADLVLWQKSHQLVLAVYRTTDAFPQREHIGLTSQLRRAAVSVPANVAEGFKRRGKRHKARLLNIAQASVSEAEYYLTLAGDLRYGIVDEVAAHVEEISKLLEALRSTILSPKS